ncbi:glycoside hydrolase family 31 protein [Streptomyces sp. NPDC005438]|uniref:glycoside hydrolase family 31 protein n=1 Tax=Streptomyces sp. NPDC005438 TaxID=3156880 RepID=UPI0033A68272
MDARDLARSTRVVGVTRALRSVGVAWRRRSLDARAVSSGGERARTPGELVSVEPLPGGGLVRFARSRLRVRVTVQGAVFCGWDGAEPEPSYALVCCPAADERAQLEPDMDGGWRVVSRRVLVTVSRRGVVEVCTPGGRVLRREWPPRWWERPDGAPGVARWSQLAELPAEARVFGLGGSGVGPGLPSGAYRLWNSSPTPLQPDLQRRPVTMPVQWVVSGAGAHLVFHDNSAEGGWSLRRGAEGAGSGHDQPARGTLRMSGGPVRYWVLVGTPARVARSWAQLTGGPALPPSWAFGYQHGAWGLGDPERLSEVVEEFGERGLPLTAVHLDLDHLEPGGGRPRPRLSAVTGELADRGIRLMSVVEPGVPTRGGGERYREGVAAGAFVRDGRGRLVRGLGWSGEAVYPDVTDPRVRKWWGELCAERLADGFAGVWQHRDEPTSFVAFGDPTLPGSARHHVEGRGGDHREVHNVYALNLARAAFEGLLHQRPDQRPFVLSRSGWAGSQRYGGVFGGGTGSGWEGLRASVSWTLSLGLCGVPYSGPDVGGVWGAVPAELYLRWFQLGAWQPLLRTYAGRGAGARVPWAFGAEVTEGVREALRQRERLLPFWETLAQLALRTGAPYVRPLWWRYPGDRALWEVGDAFLLGDDLLVAPVCEPGVRRRTVRLPKGLWYDTATGLAHRGPGEVELAAPLSRIPVLARAGAVLPVRGAEGVELEVWAPEPGQRGGGWYAPVTDGTRERVEMERYVSLWAPDGRGPLVTREDGSPVQRPVRARGLPEE